MIKYEAQDRLLEIMQEINDLGNEARSIFLEYFPSLAETGDAYGAFTLGSSWNRYDTTLQSLIDQTEEYDEEDYEEECYD